MNPQLLTTEIPNPTGWHLSTKLDGVRAVWTGTRLLSRHGHDLRPPAWFTAQLPAIRLDGELWLGNQTFPRLLSVIQRHGGDWSGVQYHVFDLADVGTFEDRLQRLQRLQLPGHVIAIPHRICTGMDDLDAEEKRIVAAGGEGCVIRRPGCLYRPGRSGDVVKVKRIHPDIFRSI